MNPKPEMRESDDWYFAFIGEGFSRVMQGEMALSLRLRVAWLDEFLGDIQPIKATAKRAPSDFDRNTEWLRRAAGRNLKSYAHATGEPVGQIVERLLADVHPYIDAEARLVVAGYERWRSEIDDDGKSHISGGIIDREELRRIRKLGKRHVYN